jgi:outer membrane receptor protein involved in Fe transport
MRRKRLFGAESGVLRFFMAQRCLPYEDQVMSAFFAASRIFLCVVFLAVGLTTIADVTAMAQGTDTPRPLERVEINPPNQRAAARESSDAGSGSGSDQAPASDWSSSGERGNSSGTATGTVGPASSLSVITGKSQVSVGATSLPAQVQVVTPRDIQGLNNWGDSSNLFMKVAGVKALTWGQGLIGNGFAMRGFSTNGYVGVFVDGVPQNLPSAAGGTGKYDISWLAPEAIERIEIIKGPFSALYGDYALAGVVNIITKKSEPSPSLTSYGGSFGAFRAFGVLSREAWVPTPYLAEEYYTVDGYRDNSHIHWMSSFNKGSIQVFGGILSLRFNDFQADWGAPGYWPIDWVKSGLVERRTAFNTTDGGFQKRYEWVLNYAPACGERGLYATLYVDKWNHSRFYSFSGSTFANRYSPGQFARQDDRIYWGGRLYYNLVFGDVGSLIVGGETRQDQGETQQYNTIKRQRTTTVYDYDLRLSNWAVFLQGQIKPAEYLKIVGGVRWDYFTQDFDNLVRPQNSGRGFPFIRSPKIGFVVTPTENFNIFGNIGCGFRSPVNLEVSPYAAKTKRDFGLEPPEVQTYDLGFNVSLFGNLYLAADYYHTNMQREIRSVNGNPMVIGDTVRKGCELEARFYPTNNQDFSVYGNYGWVEARVIDPVTPGQFLVNDISEHTVKAGVSIQRDFGSGRNVLADLYYEYTSGAPYYGSTAIPVFGPDYDVYNLKLTYTGNGWSSFLSARCKPREYSADYTWVSNNLLVFDPQPKWEFASGLTYTFP